MKLLKVEKCFLGAMLVNPEYIKEAGFIVTPDSFFSPQNRLIFSKMLDLGDNADMVSVKMELEKSYKQELWGGIAYITELSTSEVSSARWRYYAETIKDAHDKRTIIRNAEKAITECRDDNRSAKDIYSSLIVSNVSGVITHDGISSIKDARADILKLYSDGYKDTVNPGFTNLAPLYRPRTGEFTVWTGIPNHGKSEFLDAILVNTNKTSDWRHAIFSPENQPIARHCAKIAEKLIGKPFHPGVTDRITEMDIDAFIENWGEDFIFVYPEEDELTLDHILGKVKIAIDSFGIKNFVIDPWNELEHGRPTWMTESEYIGSSLSKIRRFVRRYDVHCDIVAHPTKLRKKEGSNDYEVPTPYDISGSANWRNKPDACVTVYRNFSDNSTDVHVQKIRFKECGEVGKCSFNYNRVSGIYTGRSIE